MRQQSVASQKNVKKEQEEPKMITIEDFLKVHEKIFVVEQNRDGQLQKLLSMETGTHMEKLDSIRMYDGIPIYSGNLVKEILNRLRENEAS